MSAPDVDAQGGPAQGPPDGVPRDEIALMHDYRNVFGASDGLGSGARVLANISAVCYAHDTTATVDDGSRCDPNAMLVLEGRRQVYLHIQGMLSRAAEREVIDAAVTAIMEDSDE